MDCPSDKSPAQDDSRGDVLDWRTWSARRHPVVASVTVLFMLGLAAGVYFSFGRVLYPVLTLLVLAAATSAYYLPTCFTLDAEGITVSSLVGRRRKLWSGMRAYFSNGDDGVLVSPIARKGFLSSTRGFYLPYADNREAVLGYLDRYLPKEEVSRSE